MKDKVGAWVKKKLEKIHNSESNHQFTQCSSSTRTNRVSSDRASLSKTNTRKNQQSHGTFKKAKVIFQSNDLSTVLQCLQFTNKQQKQMRRQSTDDVSHLQCQISRGNNQALTFFPSAPIFPTKDQENLMLLPSQPQKDLKRGRISALP